jgi:hypothetical protein
LLATRSSADACGNGPDGRRDIGQSAVLVRVVRDARSIEALFQFGLRLIEHDEIRLQSQDPFDVRIEQGAHARETRHFGRMAVEAGDANDFASIPDGEYRFRHRRDERHDSLGRRRVHGGGAAEREPERHE